MDHNAGKHKTFHSTLRNFAWLAGAYGSLALFLLMDVWNRLHSRSMRLDTIPGVPPVYDPVELGLVFLWTLVAAVILVRMAAEYRLKAGTSVTLTPHEAICESGRGRLVFPFHTSFALYSPIHRQRFRVVTLTCGPLHYRIEAFYFPDFALLEKVLIKALDKNMHVPLEREFTDTLH